MYNNFYINCTKTGDTTQFGILSLFFFLDGRLTVLLTNIEYNAECTGRNEVVPPLIGFYYFLVEYILYLL
jgi:hypothetical protein